jgi:hypothetical protein
VVTLSTDDSICRPALCYLYPYFGPPRKPAFFPSFSSASRVSGRPAPSCFRCCQTARSPAMSRFTSAYHINRSSAHRLAERQSLAASTSTNPNVTSPPYTDDLGFSTNAASHPHLFGHSHDLSFSGLPTLPAFSETPTRMPSRITTSVLGYNHFGRERSRQRASRWLVLVLPPAFISQPQGAFGHTRSTGPSSRLPQGLLLPLYPTVNQSVPQPSEYCVSYLLIAFRSKPPVVCATKRDRPRIQFPEHYRDMPIPARQRSRFHVHTADKRRVVGYPLGASVRTERSSSNWRSSHIRTDRV